jgi:hypothetical protein
VIDGLVDTTVEVDGKVRRRHDVRWTGMVRRREAGFTPSALDAMRE